MIKKMNNDKLDIENGIFHLSDLKIVKNIQSEQFYFELKKDYKKKLFQKALSISKTVRNLSKSTDINYFNLWDCIKRAPTSLTNLKKLSAFLIKNSFAEFSLEEIEKNIECIKGGFTPEKIYQPKFPISLATKSGMRFLAHIYHDGSIGKENRQPLYVNQSLSECKEFLEDAKNIFGYFNREIKKFRDGTYRMYLPTIIGDIMTSIGYTPGDKTRNNSNTLNFLNNIYEKELISEFLAKAFNDDGFIGNRGIGLYQVSLIKDGIKKPSNVLLLDKLFLERLGLKVHGPKLKTLYKNRHGQCSGYIINIYSKYQLKIFNKHIKLIDRKRKKLEKYLNNGYKIED